MKQKTGVLSTCVLLCLVALCGGCCDTAMAADGYVCKHGYHTLGDKTLINGVGDHAKHTRHYWISDALSDAMHGHISDAMNEWVNTTESMGVTTPLWINATTVKKNSVIDVYKGTLSGSAVGKTTFWNGDDKVKLANGALAKDYRYTKITLDTGNMSGWKGARKKGVVSHEFGHAFGLSHNTTTKASIMYPSDSGRKPTRASKSDLKIINHLY